MAGLIRARPSLSCDVAGLEGKSALVDVVGQVDQDAFRPHPECRGHELGVEAGNKVGQAGASQQPQPDAGRVEDVAQVIRRCPGLGALGLLGDQQVRLPSARGT